MLTAQEILDLNKDASNLLSDMIKDQIVDKDNMLLESKCRDGNLEYSFQDGTVIELAVIRDFNDNMKPVSVVVDHYDCNNFYTQFFKV